MAQSLEQNCTPLKLEYDSCFNSWFEGYLEPAVSASASPENRAKYSKDKAEEYERKCGKIWASYRDCVQKAVKEKGLDELLDQARKENPLKEPPQVSSQPS
ncbi:mitochondrial distribution/morphology family 35/apoptosis [Gloeopeniophorella convolvens]|nr:mitochondrial distribution/morphology family 35/apoptosis [Gloeopeniophorella convolvens]